MLIIHIEAWRVIILQTAVWFLDDDQAFDLVEFVYQFETFLGPHDHQGRGQAIGKSAGVCHDGHTDDPVGYRVAGLGIHHVGIPYVPDLKKIAIIAAGGKRSIGKTDNFVHRVRRCIRLRSAYADPPGLAI